MVRVKLIILFLILPLLSFAQDKIDDYYSSELGRKFNIRASSDQINQPTIYLEVFTGILKDTHYFKLGNERTAFIKALEQAKIQFVSWKNSVKENNVSHALKRMDITFPLVEIYAYDGIDQTFKYLETLELKPIFSVLGNNQCRFQLSAVSTLSNELAYSILFTKEKEFNKLSSKISAEIVLRKIEMVK